MSVPASPQENHSRSSAAAAASDPPKRKRGRPRKHPLPEATEAPVREADVPAAVNGKRRRGRPPKNPRAAEPALPKFDDINAPEIQEKLRFRSVWRKSRTT
jgi:RNA polymerase primary sigma factor